MLETITSPVLLGVLAGLAVAVPLGPMALLILDRGMRGGLPTGLAAAAGVGGVDLAYAAVATAATGLVAGAVEPVRGPLTVAVACVLAVLGVRGLVTARAQRGGAAPSSAAGQPAGPLRTFLAFVALTAINPGTLLHFGALAVAVGGRLTSTADRVVFVLGVGVGSLSWQATLALVGSRLGRSPRPGVLRWSRVVGSCLLLLFAGILLLDAR